MFVHVHTSFDLYHHIPAAIRASLSLGAARAIRANDHEPGPRFRCHFPPGISGYYFHNLFVKRLADAIRVS